MSPSSRVSIFIDGGYLFHVFAPYRAQGYKYSPKRLVRKLSENYVLQRVHYIDSINQREAKIKAKQERFYYGVLRDGLGWEVTILPLQFPGGVPTQKGTDAALTLRLHERAIKDEFDTAILLAADADFVPAVELVKQHGKIVRNAYFSVRPSFHLQQACNGSQIRLDDIDFCYLDSAPQILFALTNPPAVAGI